MIITSKTETTELVCDGCEATEKVDGGFSDAVETAKEKGWKFNKRVVKTKNSVKEIWEHYCPECRELEGI